METLEEEQIFQCAVLYLNSERIFEIFEEIFIPIFWIFI